MPPTMCTRGIIALGIALGVFAWIFDDKSALLAAALLAAFIVLRSVILQRHAADVLQSLSMERLADNEIVRQGAVIGIENTITITIPAGVRVIVEDLLPAGAVIQHGECRCTLSSPGTKNITLSYVIALRTTGEIGFPGFIVVIEDPFFRLDGICRGGVFGSPHLSVEPASLFERPKGTGRFGEREEEEKRSPIQGYGIRSFRPFVPGDDYRHIDWKLSAKYDRLYVREYTGLAESHPLMIIDMPGRNGTHREPAIDQMTGAALDAVRNAIREFQGCSVVVISGPNLIRYMPFEHDSRRVVAALRAAEPAVRLSHMYRTLNAAQCHLVMHRIEPSESTYPQTLRQLYDAFAASIQRSTFDMQIGRVLAAGNRSTVYLFSLFSGDQSHIRHIILQSKRMGMDTHLIIPGSAQTPEILRKLAGYNTAGVQVIS